MLKYQINSKEINFNCTSFRALEELEKTLNKSVYRFIGEATQLSISDIFISLKIFSRYASNPLSDDDLQNCLNENGLAYLMSIAQDCIIAILNGQPKPKENKVKKK